MNNDRRRLLAAATTLVALPMLSLLPAGEASAQALPPLPADHPQGKALGYVANAAETRHASFKPGSNCANCQFYTAANQGCSLFAGYSVAPAGWCAAWARKA